MPGTVHIIGAGLAGLAAGLSLSGAGARVAIHESAGHAGGRCRSYHDAALDLEIDNGNHLVLSGNHAMLAYAREIGSVERLVGPETAEFAFIDLASHERWTLRLGAGRLPWWIFDADRRVPHTRAADYLSLAPLLFARSGTVAQCIKGRGAVYDRLLRPLVVAALNTDPEQASARLAAAIIRETLGAGGQACRPLIAREGLTSAFIDPALDLLQRRGATISFGHRLRAIVFKERAIEALDFGEDVVRLDPGDRVILAVPPIVAADLVPGLSTPDDFRAIVNAHFRIDPPAGFPAMIGVINAATEWIFTFPGRLSVTISAADRLMENSREELAAMIWREVSDIARLPAELPRWQIVRERRATFAATPQQDEKRPAAATACSNLFLAGDWTATGLPGTIEGAIRSGRRAAVLAG